jgi:glucose-1-phosphate adenylyltransferase
VTSVIAVILGGGRGTRMFPLTLPRSKPAVPIGGKYRLIDVPVSNCLHSDIRRIYVLTQYQSESLNKHVNNTYKFDIFSSGFVTVVAAEQTEESGEWFQGTADAVRQSMRHVGAERWEDIIILSGDQLYRMDFRDMLETHRSSRADATVAMKAVPPEQAPAFGIMQVDGTGRIIKFEEKPSRERLPTLASPLPSGPGYLASMGIYIFRRRALDEALANTANVDFGRHVIPAAVPRLRVQAHVHDGYWEDVGTIGSYFEANLALTDQRPAFSFYDPSRPIYTHPRFLPATKVASCEVTDSLLSEGCYIDSARIERSVIGIRSRIARGARIRRSLLLGADWYESVEDIERAMREGTPAMGVGEESVIENAIIDKNARVGRGVRIVNEKKERERDAGHYHIRDGIVVIPKGAVIPDGTVI